MPTFQDARFKIERAQHHIAELEARIKLLEQSNVAVVQINPEFRNEVIKHDLADKKAVGDIALLIGDAVHNLKCALDYAWIETITKLAPHALGKFTKFPVYPTYDALEAALRGNRIDQPSCGNLFNLMLNEIQSYSGGNLAIWPIHRLDIRDKHRLLIPTVPYTSVSGIETQDETGQISRNGFTAGTKQEPPWYVPMPVGVHVKEKGKVSFDITFGYGNPEDEVVYADMLSFYPKHLLRIVETLERLV